jgi:hypothetical protein
MEKHLPEIWFRHLIPSACSLKLCMFFFCLLNIIRCASHCNLLNFYHVRDQCMYLFTLAPHVSSIYLGFIFTCLPYFEIDSCNLLSRHTNKMQLCNRIYYSKVFWRFNMFRAAHRSSSEALNCICSLWFLWPSRRFQFSTYIIFAFLVALFC